jgi:hypothetical protein
MGDTPTGTPVRLIKFVVRAASRNGQRKGAQFTLREDNPNVAAMLKDPGYDWTYVAGFVPLVRPPQPKPAQFVALDGLWGDFVRTIRSLGDRVAALSPDELRAWVVLVDAREDDIRAAFSALMPMTPELEDVVDEARRQRRAAAEMAVVDLDDPDVDPIDSSTPPADAVVTPVTSPQAPHVPPAGHPLDALRAALADDFSYSDKQLVALAANAGIVVPKGKRERAQLVDLLLELADKAAAAVPESTPTSESPPAATPEGGTHANVVGPQDPATPAPSTTDGSTS